MRTELVLEERSDASVFPWACSTHASSRCLPTSTVVQSPSSVFSRVHFENLRNAPVLMLDVNQDFEHNPSVQEELMRKVGA